MTLSALPARVGELAREVLGDVERVTPLRGSHGQIRAWRLDVGTGPVVARCPRSARTARQEAEALRRMRRVPGAEGRVPDVIAATRDAVLVTWVDGTVWSTSTPDVAVVERVSWLHAVPLEDRDPVDLHAAVEMRGSALAASLESIAPEHAVWFRRLTVEGAPSFRGRPRVLCHGDLRRDNIVVQGGAAGLIDFEHARGDDVAFDVARLELDLGWPRAGRALDGLWQGLDEPGRRLSRAMVACATLVWGRSHGDEAFERVGRRQIRALRSE